MKFSVLFSGIVTVLSILNVTYFPEMVPLAISSPSCVSTRFVMFSRASVSEALNVMLVRLADSSLSHFTWNLKISTFSSHTVTSATSASFSIFSSAASLDHTVIVFQISSSGFMSISHPVCTDTNWIENSSDSTNRSVSSTFSTLTTIVSVFVSQAGIV